ncbi:hypothetical protein NW752_004374 [Fusarium irregulare]|uniref:Uncharacterized protein n=1 Tax=Fusarium irregulare TaxID=2494466 RepID=A0A9W8PP34_9HYPO|nr:hypothetical protein NW766_007280 [Fusarium irregulare]KAJ4021367.1 hypothetical protein NW752_004374 [Fusarium irregulare]
MHDHDPTEDLGVTCPSGSNFYICRNDPNQFIGCCAINPCGTRKGLCPDQHLKAATFDKAYEEYILPQACINDNVDVAWHACSWSTSSFMGCCAVDPCNGGCPARQLRAAKLSDDSRNAECFLGGKYKYEPKPSYTSSSSQNPTTSTSACSTTTSSTTTASTTIVSTTASSFTTSIVTTSASSTTISSSSKPTSAPPKGIGGPELKYLWILFLLVLLVPAIIYVLYKKRSKRRKAEIDEVFSSDSDADKRTPKPINNYSMGPPSQLSGLAPPPFTEKANSSTNRHDFETEDVRVAFKSEISQTRSAEFSQSQINLSINLSTPSPGSSRTFQKDSPFPPPQCEPIQELPGNDSRSVELEATPISRGNSPNVAAELDGTSTQIHLSDRPDSHQRAVSQPELGREAPVVPENTSSEAQRRAMMNLPNSTTRHVEAKAGREANDKNTPQTNLPVDKRDDRPRVPRQDLAHPPRNDAKTEEGRAGDETAIQQTHSAEPTRSQTSPPIDMRSDRPLQLKRGQSYPLRLNVQTGDGRATNNKEFPEPYSLFGRDKSLPTLEEALHEKGKGCSAEEQSILPVQEPKKPVNKNTNRARRKP